MLNENAKTWVAALRSGEFEQAKGALKDATGYCCLGVACELYRRETGCGEWSNENWFLEKKGHLHFKVRKWLGLRTEFGDFGQRALTVLNDDGATFSEIADIIESDPDGLFIKQ